MMAGLPSPFLNWPESARPEPWPRNLPSNSSMSWCRSRSTRPIPIGCPTNSRWRPAISLPCRSARARRSAWSGPSDVTIKPGLHNRMKDVELKLDYPPLRPELRRFVDWVSDYTLSPRGMVLRMCLRMGEHLGPARDKVGVRLAGPAPARMTAARGRVLRLLADGMVRSKSEAAHEAGVSAGVVNGLIDDGALETVVLPPEPVARQPDPDHRAPEFTEAQRAAADTLHATVGQGRVFGDARRRRHRLGQDRGLFRGGGGNHPARQAGADPDAGDRADRAVPRSLRRALRRPPGGMAFGDRAAAARADLVRGRSRRGLGGGRRALGAVSALCQSRPDRGR